MAEEIIFLYQNEMNYDKFSVIQNTTERENKLQKILFSDMDRFETEAREYLIKNLKNAN